MYRYEKVDMMLDNVHIILIVISC